MDKKADKKCLSRDGGGSHVQAGAPPTPRRARTWACGSPPPRWGRGRGVCTRIKGLKLKLLLEVRSISLECKVYGGNGKGCDYVSDDVKMGSGSECWVIIE